MARKYHKSHMNRTNTKLMNCYAVGILQRAKIFRFSSKKWKSTVHRHTGLIHRCTKFPKKFRDYLKILGARTVTWSKFHTEDPEILGTTVQSLVSWTIRRSEFVHPWFNPNRCTAKRNFKYEYTLFVAALCVPWQAMRDVQCRTETSVN